ncbi:MAG: hypothetical protein ACK47B_11075 [Armatimonadota bacterium]
MKSIIKPCPEPDRPLAVVLAEPIVSMLRDAMIVGETTALEERETYHPSNYRGTQAYAEMVHLAALHLVSYGCSYKEIKGQPRITTPGPNPVQIVFAHGKRIGNVVTMNKKGAVSQGLVRKNLRLIGQLSLFKTPEERASLGPLTVWAIADRNDAEQLSLHLVVPEEIQKDGTAMIAQDIETIYTGSLLPSPTIGNNLPQGVASEPSIEDGPGLQ